MEGRAGNRFVLSRINSRAMLASDIIAAVRALAGGRGFADRARRDRVGGRDDAGVVASGGGDGEEGSGGEDGKAAHSQLLQWSGLDTRTAPPLPVEPLYPSGEGRT